MQVIIAEELIILFIAHTIVNQNQTVAVFDQQAAHGPAAHVVFISWICFVPDALGHYAEHGATIKFEVACIDTVKFHLDLVCKRMKLTINTKKNSAPDVQDTPLSAICYPESIQYDLGIARTCLCVDAKNINAARVR